MHVRDSVLHIACGFMVKHLSTCLVVVLRGGRASRVRGACDARAKSRELSRDGLCGIGPRHVWYTKVDVDACVRFHLPVAVSLSFGLVCLHITMGPGSAFEKPRPQPASATVVPGPGGKACQSESVPLARATFKRSLSASAQLFCRIGSHDEFTVTFNVL